MRKFEFMKIKQHGWLMTLSVFYCSLQMAFGVLTATVTPGYTFGPSEIPSIPSLNLLGEPSILITGTVDGSTGLTPGSVNGALLSDSVVDGMTLNYNGSSPRAIQVALGGISSNQIAISLWGGGVYGGGGSKVTLIVDTNYFVLATNSIANTNSISPTNGVPDTNNIIQPFPWLTMKPLALTDTNVNPNAGIQVTKLQNLGTNGILVSTPQGTNTPSAMGPPFVLNSFTQYFTNTFTNITVIGTNLDLQPIFSTNFTTNVFSSVKWTFNLLQVTTNINLPSVAPTQSTPPLPNSPRNFVIPHFFGSVPSYIHGYLSVLGANVITTNIVGSVTNYFTNAPNITANYVAGSAIDWRDVYFATNINGSGFPNPVWNSATVMPLFTYSADTNYVYVNEAGLNKQNGQSYYWHVYTNPPTSGAFVAEPLNATNFQLNLLIRY